MTTVTDQIGNVIKLNRSPRRIISVVPSQTELLYDLGLRDEVVGITKFCVHPDEWFRTKRRVGGTKQLNIEKILSLNPDLVIGNKEENTAGQIEELMAHCPVWVSNIQTVEEAFEMIRSVGELIGKKEKAIDIIGEIKAELSIPEQEKALDTAAYFIWKDPYMVAGGNTFINNMMGIAGFKNVFANKLRYPPVTVEEINEKHPACLLLSSEPFPFKEKHLEKIQKQFPGSKLLLVDGEMFSWYGSRMKLAMRYFNSIER